MLRLDESTTPQTRSNSRSNSVRPPVQAVQLPEQRTQLRSRNGRTVWGQVHRRTEGAAGSERAHPGQQDERPADAVPGLGWVGLSHLETRPTAAVYERRTTALVTNGPWDEPPGAGQSTATATPGQDRIATGCKEESTPLRLSVCCFIII
uniref:(northern house mosquito) hypothetical protein n=1 Tax=Culex pipiens TaxID=7175 RepID=A0A8D8NZV9_CULPI